MTASASEPTTPRDSSRARSSAPAPEVYAITGAQDALSDDQYGRTRRYLISMAVRTGCVLLAIIVPGWPRWALIAGAVVLPYLAVVVANGGRRRREGHDPVALSLDAGPLAVTAAPVTLTHVNHDSASGRRSP